MTRYARGDVMADTEDWLLLKGNLTVEEFWAALNRYWVDTDLDTEDAARCYPENLIRRGWFRCVPIRDDHHKFEIFPAAPHARGAFDVTYVER